MAVQLGNTFALSNLLAPASGTTHAVKFNVTVSNNKALINLPGYLQQIGDFTPQAMIVDNTANNVVVTVGEIGFGWSRIVPAGAYMTFQYPATSQQQITVSSAGAANVSIVLLDFPAFPDASYNPATAAGSLVSIVGTPAVTLTGSALLPAPVSYAASAVASIAIGGTAVTVFGIGTIVSGAVITNPSTATEMLFIDTVASASLAETGTTFALAAGQSFSFGPASGAITANAATAGHAFSAVRF